MDRLRLILANVQKQLVHLTVTQKLLIGSLCVLLLMTLFLVSQYTGSPTMVALLPGGPADEQQKATAFLRQQNIACQVGTDGKVMVTPDVRYVALAAMTKEHQLPGDKKLLFEGLVGTSNWLESATDKQMKQNIALQNELAMVIRAIPGMDEASVFISRPADNGGIGAAAKKTVAQVAVFPATGQGLDQPTVNALADLVAGSVSGLDPRDVSVIDGRNKRSYHAISEEDLAAGGGSYMEQVERVEKRVQEKVAEHLRFIPDAIVSVNAIVDAARRESVTTKVLNKGDGTVSVPVEETTSTDNSTNTSKGGGEAGLNSNIGMSINGAGGSSGTTTSTENSTVKSEVRFGETTMKQRDASGRPTKINVTVSVPREYILAILKQKKASPAGSAAPAGGGAAGAEPTDAEIATEFDTGVKGKIEEMISPLVETDGVAMSGGTATQLVAGTVKAFLIPVSMTGMGSGMGGSSKTGFAPGAPGGMGISMLLDNGAVKTVGLGVLAVVALGMMFTMVRKAGKSQTMPTAEELVGIPPALEPGTDVVGEAVEGDTAMQGIEVDDESLKTGKMLEEIGTLVKSNPSTAASVFNRWLSEHE